MSWASSRGLFLGEGGCRPGPGRFPGRPSAVEPFAVLRQVHRVDGGAHNLTVEFAAGEFLFERVADVDRRLPTELDHHAVGVGRLDDVGDLLGRDGLEEEAV